MGIKHVAIGTAIAAALGVGAYFSFLNKPEPSQATQPAGLEQLVTAPGQPTQPPQTGSQYTTNETDYVDSCGYHSNCSLPEEYRNRIILCENPKSHCEGKTDTYHEQIIGYNSKMRKPYLNQNIAQSYIDQNSVRISGLEGELKNYEGKEFNDVFFLVVDEDKCKNYIVNPGEQIPGDFENMGIILLAKETDGIYQIASSHTGSYRGSNGGDGREGACPGQPAPNININVNTNVTCPTIPAPTQTQGPASEPAPQPTTLGEYIAPRLTDNSWNEIGFKTSIPYEEIYLAFCENGTDGRGNVINSCNKFTKAFPPAIFRYIKTDENDPKTHIYRGYIPNIPGTEEATYKMIGYMLNNIQYWENSTQTGAVQNIQHSTQPKKKKRNIIKRIFGKKN